MPVRPFRNLEAVLIREPRVIHVAARLGECLLKLLVINIAHALEEQERKDELLVIAGVNHTAQECRRAPQVTLQLRLRYAPAVLSSLRPESVEQRLAI